MHVTGDVAFESLLAKQFHKLVDRSDGSRLCWFLRGVSTVFIAFPFLGTFVDSWLCSVCTCQLACPLN